MSPLNNKLPERNPLKIFEVNPIIFYSGKEDELLVELVEFNYGELIIRSLSSDVLVVKALSIEDEEVEIEWKQMDNGLRISLPQAIVADTKRDKCRLVIKF